MRMPVKARFEYSVWHLIVQHARAAVTGRFLLVEGVLTIVVVRRAVMRTRPVTPALHHVQNPENNAFSFFRCANLQKGFALLICTWFKTETNSNRDKTLPRNVLNQYNILGIKYRARITTTIAKSVGSRCSSAHS